MTRKISGKLLALDIQRGASYEELLERYDVTPQAMDRFFEGLVKAGRVDASALPIAEDMKGKDLRTCPKCAAQLKTDSEECPSCGILVSKFLKRKNEEEERLRQVQASNPVKEQPNVTRKTEQAISPWGSFLVIFFVIILGLVIALVVLNPVKDTTKVATVTPPRTVAQSLPILSVNAYTLAATYHDNEILADERYKGRLLNITGDVQAIAKDVLNNPYVSLKGPDRAFLGVKCAFRKEDAGRLVSLRPGDKVQIEGICHGRFGVVLVNDCELVR